MFLPRSSMGDRNSAKRPGQDWPMWRWRLRARRKWRINKIVDEMRQNYVQILANRLAKKFYIFFAKFMYENCVQKLCLKFVFSSISVDSLTRRILSPPPSFTAPWDPVQGRNVAWILEGNLAPLRVGMASLWKQVRARSAQTIQIQAF